MLEGVSTDVILGMDFLKKYNPSISWVDSLVGMLCLVENDAVCVNPARICKVIAWMVLATLG